MTDDTPPQLDYARPEPVRRMRWWSAVFVAHCLASWLTALVAAVCLWVMIGEAPEVDARLLLILIFAPLILPIAVSVAVYVAIIRGGHPTWIGIIGTLAYGVLFTVAFLYLRRRRGTG